MGWDLCGGPRRAQFLRIAHGALARMPRALRAPGVLFVCIVCLNLALFVVLVALAKP